MAIEATTQPLLVVLSSSGSSAVARLRAYGVWHGVPAGALIGLVTYSYTGSRLLGPLLARALVVFAGTGSLALRAVGVGDLRSSRSCRSASTRSAIPGT